MTVRLEVWFVDKKRVNLDTHLETPGSDENNDTQQRMLWTCNVTSRIVRYRRGHSNLRHSTLVYEAFTESRKYGKRNLKSFFYTM